MRTSLWNSRSLWLLLVCCLFSSWAYSQTRDWSTIRETDTPYFLGGTYAAKAPFHLGTSGRLIRRIQVDSVRQLTNERRLYFPTVLRSIDTSAPIWPGDPYGRHKSGWQGPFCRQLIDGTDEFYNFRNDMIRIRTRAAVGTIWTLFKDTSGIEIRATLTAVGAVSLNGITDSFRQMTLQAYQNQLPVAHFHNGRTLEWTKLQGWAKTLDWFPFPYMDSHFGQPFSWRAGVPEDTSTYDRLADTPDLSKGRTLADLQGLYKPGTILRIYTERGSYGHYKEFYRYDQDSVLNIQISGLRVIVQFWRSSCEFQLMPPTGPSRPGPYWVTTPYPGTFYTDTFSADSGRIAKHNWILPDAVDTGVSGTSWNYLLTDSLCGRPQVCADLNFLYQAITPGLYWVGRYQGSVSDYTQTATGLGRTRSYHYSGSFDGPIRYLYSRLEYLRTDSCTYGTYLDVPALSISQVGQNNGITLYPNPANDFLQLTLPEAAGVVNVGLVNLQGTVVATQPVTQPTLSMPVGHLPVGVYFVRFSGKKPIKLCKLIIAH
ncbi:MAG: T9SS type A sorting domain-containing protein [Sphingobacteriales bacterium]|nr:MAG: T9SS type A sorting domain-containing protein [Sphingobacteriales bacterium]